MGTRGAWGFVINDNARLTYNHFDSYPEGLGSDILAWARQVSDWDKVKQQAMDLHMVNEQESPTEEEALKVAEFSDSGVSTGQDWYAALRKCQGDPDATLRSGYMTENSEFPLDSLFCEWAYLIDLDKGVFEVYQGFQTEVPTAGRWAGRPTAEEDNDRYAAHVEWCKANGREPWDDRVSKYKAVMLREVWPLHDLPTDAEWSERLVGDDE